MRSVESDVLRGLTKREANALPAATARSVDVDLCPDARVYALCLSASRDPAAVGTDWWARLVLQDSEIRVYEDPYSFGADLPGLAWPGYAKLEIAPGVTATLSILYGHCR